MAGKWMSGPWVAECIPEMKSVRGSYKVRHGVRREGGPYPLEEEIIPTRELIEAAPDMAEILEAVVAGAPGTLARAEALLKRIKA